MSGFSRPGMSSPAQASAASTSAGVMTGVFTTWSPMLGLVPATIPPEGGGILSQIALARQGEPKWTGRLLIAFELREPNTARALVRLWRSRFPTPTITRYCGHHPRHLQLALCRVLRSGVGVGRRSALRGGDTGVRVGGWSDRRIGR